MDVYGEDRITQFETLEAAVRELDSASHDVWTTDLTLVPISSKAWRALSRSARSSGESWAFVTFAESQKVVAVDEISAEGASNPAAAVTYVELHTRLVSWWLIHAWRSVDLLADTLASLLDWRITSSAVTARAVIEETGCFLDELLKIAEAWSEAKEAVVPDQERPQVVRDALLSVVNQASFGTRVGAAAQLMPATNVLTYVKKLAKATGNSRYHDWYDWLSDAAHPAYGARVAMSSAPMRHESGSVIVRFYARSPLSRVSSAGAVEQMPSNIALDAADATIVAGRLVCSLLEQALRVVDDFGLTTAAATYTTREYWRDFKPVRGSRACPCGRGKWSSCGHRWMAPAPVVEILAMNAGGEQP